jgi:uncharacterized repeat protein (TIGR01451 family)
MAFALMALAVPAIIISTARPAGAAPFDPSDPSVYIAQGIGGTQLSSADQNDGQVTFTSIGAQSKSRYNAIGYRLADNFVYGFTNGLPVNGTGIPQGHLIKLDNGGVAEDLGAVAGIPSPNTIAMTSGSFGGNFGTIHTADTLYVLDGNTAQSALYAVDIVTRTAELVSLSQPVNVIDFTWAQGYLWGITTTTPAPKRLVRINPANGQVSIYDASSLVPDDDNTGGDAIGYGAAWTYGNGNIAFSNNTTGNITQIKVVNPTAATPTFTKISWVSGPPSLNNDGTTSPARPADLRLVKDVVPEVPQPGGAITYTLTITNLGPGPSSGYVVNDEIPASIGSPATTTDGCTIDAHTLICIGGDLAVGASATITITGTAPTPFPSPVTNTAIVTGNELDPNPANNTDSATITPPAAGITIVKSAHLNDTNGNHAADEGETIAYSFLVTNTGNVPLHNVGVTDAKVGPVSCPLATLAPAAAETCTATYTVTAADIIAGVVHNSATAHGAPPGTDTPVTSPPDTADVPTATPAPAITIVKHAALNDTNHNGSADAGETIVYTFTVTNTGNVSLHNVGVTDTLAGPVICPQATLPPGGTETCAAAPYTVTQADVDSGNVHNSATSHGTPPGTNTPPITSPPDTTDTPTTATPAVTIVKQATLNDTNSNGFADVGETITYSFTVTNTGQVTLHDVGVTDAKAGPVTCPQPILTPTQSEVCTADTPYTVTQADVDSGVVHNSSTAHGTPPRSTTPVVSPPSTADVPTTPAAPAITVVKHAVLTDANGNGGADEGEVIDYTFTVTNTGNVVLHDVGVTDPKVGPVTCPQDTLAPGATEVCTAAPYTVTAADVAAGVVHNSATSHGTPPGTNNPPVQSPPSTADVPIGGGVINPPGQPSPTVPPGSATNPAGPTTANPPGQVPAGYGTTPPSGGGGGSNGLPMLVGAGLLSALAAGGWRIRRTWHHPQHG